MMRRRAAVVPLTSENIVLLQLADVEFPRTWNMRSTPLAVVPQASGEGESDTETDRDESSFTKIMLSIAREGQDDPIVVRPNPDKTSAKAYACITGFTRGAAIETLGKMSLSEARTLGIEASPYVNTNEPTIRAIIRHLTEEQAVILNVRENSARVAPNPPDLAWALGRIATMAPHLTARQIAEQVGISATYSTALLRIMKSFETEVLHHWRNAASQGQVQLSVEAMSSLCVGKGSAKERTPAYFAELAGNVPADVELPEHVPRTRSLRSAFEKSGVLGTLFGALVREGHIVVESDGLDMIHLLLPELTRREVSGETWEALAKTFEGAYYRTAHSGEKATARPTASKNARVSEQVRALKAWKSTL